MAATFWQTIADFQCERASIDRLQCESCKDMHDLTVATVQVVADSRALIRHVDEILSRDGELGVENRITHRDGGRT